MSDETLREAVALLHSMVHSREDCDPIAHEQVRAALAAEPREYGRPPLDPATKAHDDAYMAGLIRGRELEREAAEPERTTSGSQQSRPLASQFVTTANSAEPAGLVEGAANEYTGTDPIDDAYARGLRDGIAHQRAAEPPALDADALIAELSESPLPGARYAVTVVKAHLARLTREEGT